MSIRESWKIMESWLGAYAPSLPATLNPAATPADKALERRLGVTLADTVRESYLIHNGKSKTSDGLFNVWRLLPLDEVVDQAEELHQLSIDHGFNDFDKRKMGPLLKNGGGDLYYTDTGKAADSLVIEG